MKRGLGLVGLLLVGLVGCSQSPSDAPVWIGQVVSLAETDHRIGPQTIRAIERDLLAREIHQIAFRHVDGLRSPARAQAIRLLAVNQVAALVVGPGIAHPEEVVAAARSHGAITVVLDELAEPVRDSAVLLGSDPVQRAEALARFAQRHSSDRTARLLVDWRDPRCAVAARAFGKTWRSLGQLCREETVADSVPVLGTEPVVALALPMTYRHWPTLSVPSGQRPLILSLGFDGPVPATKLPLHYATIVPPIGQRSTACQQWFEQCQKLEDEPVELPALLARDVVSLFREAIPAVGVRTPEMVRDLLRRNLLERSRFEGIAGTVTWPEGRPFRTLFLHRQLAEKREWVETVQP